MALRVSTDDQEKLTIQLNRALAHIRNGEFDAALRDTNGLDQIPSTAEKALYRMGQAYYHLGDFPKSLKAMQKLVEKYPGNEQGAKEISRVKARCRELLEPIIDFELLHKEVSKTRPLHLDHATFLGPVTVRESPGRGRGLFTTKDVRAGELLLCEKAFARCYTGDRGETLKGSSGSTILINSHTDRITIGTQGALITDIVQKLYKNPSLQAQFTELHHGDYQPVDVSVCDGAAVVDT
jgi:tetratricopeptide (TPR) repeat protein